MLVVAMLLFFSPQVLGILSFGSFIPDQANVEATLKDYFARYEALEAESIDPDAWKECGDEVRGTAGGWIKSYRAAAGRRGERDIALQQAATTMVQITNCNITNAEQRLKLADVFKQQIQSR